VYVRRNYFSFLGLNIPVVIVKASSGPRYVVSYRPTLPVAKLKTGTRVSLDMTTLTIMRILPREVDPLVYKMSMEDPGGASFAGIGGLGEQVRELREVFMPKFSLNRSPNHLVL
jgi:ATP-dependent 26S proteasome regulatory subunit